jgi:NAD(P)-dependent dehydrogenase (short-subunit alcohol dehydrogenase family)
VGLKNELDSENALELKDKLFSETFSQWSDTFNTNVFAVYFTTVAFLPLLQAGKKSLGHLSASVIVISSMSGIMRHAQGHFSYNAAKGATIHLARLCLMNSERLACESTLLHLGTFQARCEELSFIHYTPAESCSNWS